MSNLAPIVLFVYNRINVLKETVEALQKNYLSDQSELIIFSDGPRSENDFNRISAIRKYLRTINGFKAVIIHEAETNRGLATSVISGVEFVFKTYDKVIVLEDDITTSPNFLSFMNAALDNFETKNDVFSISGFSFDLKLDTFEFERGYFLNRGWSWGWATWSNRWNKVDWSVRDYNSFKHSSKRRKEFACGGSDLNAMLDKQMKGKIDSWAIRWFYAQYLCGGLTYFPYYSKAFNNGFGENATHTRHFSKRYLPIMDDDVSYHFTFPQDVKLSFRPQQKFKQRMGYFSRIKSKIEINLKLCLGYLKK